MTDDQLVISPAQAAAILGVDPSTVRRWVREGACPDAFAALPGTRVGVPRWWVDQIVSAPVVVAGADGATASPPASVGRGGPTLRTVPGDATPGAA